LVGRIRLMADLDISKLLLSIEKQLADPDRILRAVSKSLAEEAVGLIKQGFRDERDPYGSPWRPKLARDGRKTLSGPTGRLKQFFPKEVDTNGFRISPIVEYAAYHQDPKRANLPQRMMVPSEERGMPKDWADAFNEAATEIIAEALKVK
jgi:phage gpG-like protein